VWAESRNAIEEFSPVLIFQKGDRKAQQAPWPPATHTRPADSTGLTQQPKQQRSLCNKQPLCQAAVPTTEFGLETQGNDEMLSIAEKNSGFPNKILQVDWFLIQPDPFPQYTLSEAKEMAIFEIFMALQNYLW